MHSSGKGDTSPALDWALVQGSTVPCYAAGDDGRLRFANKALEILTGYPAAELIGQPFSFFRADVPSTGPAPVFQGENRQETMKIRHRNGRTIKVMVTTVALRESTGDQEVVFGIVADLSRYQSVLDTLRSRNDRLGALASIATRINVYRDTRRLAREAMQAVASLLPVRNLLLILVDPDTGMLALHEGYNLPHEDFQRYHAEKGWDDCLEGQVARDKNAILIEDVSADSKAVHYEPGAMSLGLIPLLARDRVVGVLSVSSRAPYRLDQEDMEFLVTLGSQLGTALENARLIGALRESNARLLQQNQDLEELLSVISHDLRSPLATIGGYASMLMKKGDRLSNEEKVDFAERIFRKTKETSGRFDDLLDVFRISLGQEEETAVKLNPMDILQQALLEVGFGNESPQPVVELPERFPILLGYPGHLMHIFTNLFSNSIKFMGDQARPTITVTHETVEITGKTAQRFTVTDNGMGIHPDYLSTIFRPFTRGPSMEDIPGTGVGLASVNRIVRSHQGTVEIESTVGEGTSVIFTLPWKKVEK